jgi:NitT/TauT family transport system ATP-binding protein
MVGGLAAPSSGKLFINGNAVVGPNEQIGTVFQEAHLLPWRTVLNNVLFPAELRKRNIREYEARARELLELTGLRLFADHYPHELSGGMRQRVAICRALILSPEILLMDEPFSALDAMMRVELQDLLLKLWAELGLTVLFVTHDLDEALYLAQRVIMLSASPGTIAEQVEVPLAYPRRQIETRSEPAYLGLRERLYRSMVEQVMAGRAEVA